MAKAGILHDYDLHANLEPSAKGQTCVVCRADPVEYQWSDYSGEAMCRTCGAVYQLKWGSEEQRAEGDYPYFKLRDELIEPLRAYHEETGRWTCLGMMMGPRPGLDAFADWLETERPDVYRLCTEPEPETP